MFGNLKIPIEIEESVINSIKAHKYNGYGPSTGNKCRSRGGTGGPDPPWKITSYMGFYRE